MSVWLHTIDIWASGQGLAFMYVDADSHGAIPLNKSGLCLCVHAKV